MRTDREKDDIALNKAQAILSLLGPQNLQNFPAIFSSDELLPFMASSRVLAVGLNCKVSCSPEGYRLAYHINAFSEMLKDLMIQNREYIDQKILPQMENNISS